MKKARKLLAVLLSLTLCLSLVNVAALAAEGDEAGPKAIQLGMGEITGWDGSAYDYIYFGNEESSPIKWRVLDDAANTGEENGAFLLSEYLLSDDIWFDEDNTDDNTDTEGRLPNQWRGSNAQAWCQTFANDTFSGNERGAIMETSKDDGEYTSKGYQHDGGVVDEYNFPAAPGILESDTVFFLSIEEVSNENYGFVAVIDDEGNSDTGNTSRVATLKSDETKARDWWLRSAPEGSFTFRNQDWYQAAWVRGGKVEAGNWWLGERGLFFANGQTLYGESYVFTRPAFNLDKSQVLFVSAAVGGKPETIGLAAVENASDREWKLTLVNSDRVFSINEEDKTQRVVAPDAELKLELGYSNATTGTNEYISVLICDENGEVLYYGRIAQPTESNGTVEITVPGLAEGSYTLKVFNEQYNGDRQTDYSSAFQEIELTVEKTEYTVTYADGADGEIFADQNYTVAEGGTTPAFDGTPTRPGYAFTGWSAEVAETVTENVTYTARWECIHETWRAWTTTIPATCTGEGERTRTCTECGAEETETISAIGHDWGAWTVTREPTATEAGEGRWICDNCGAVRTRSIPPLGEASGEEQTESPADPTGEPVEEPIEEPIVDLTDPDVPLSDTPDVPSEPVEVPTEDLVDTDVPLSDLPDEDVPLSDLPVIPDEELAEPAEEIEDLGETAVPLADVPQTGDESLLWLALAGASALSLIALALSRKKEDKA